MSNLAAQELQSFVRRIEALDDEIRALNADKSEVFKEVKSAGFTAKTLRKVIAARRLDSTEREAADEEFDLYWHAIHGTDQGLVRAHVENTEEFDPETGEIHQPETANEAGDDAIGHVATDAADHGPVDADAETLPAGGENVAMSSAHIVTGEGAHNASVTTFTPKPLRPYCLNTDKCGGQGRKHCWSCQKAHDQAQGAA